MRTQNIIAILILMVVTALGMVTTCSIGHASPFLICDPQSGVSTYQFTGDAYFTTKTAEADGSLRYDLVGLANGSHTINVAACNSWGCSTSTPFTFSKTVPSAPLNIRIIVGSQ